MNQEEPRMHQENQPLHSMIGGQVMLQLVLPPEHTKQKHLIDVSRQEVQNSLPLISDLTQTLD